MSRTRDLSAFKPTPPSAFPPENPSGRPRASPERHLRSQISADSLSSAPSRPLRSAARNPGIVVSNDKPRSYPRPQERLQTTSSSPRNDNLFEFRDPPADYAPRQAFPSSRLEHRTGPRDRSGNNNKLYQAVSSRSRNNESLNGTFPRGSASNDPPNGNNGFLQEDYRFRRDPQGYLDNQIPDERRRSHTSSDGSFDPDRNIDLLSSNDLKGVRQNHGARTVLNAFADSVPKQQSLENQLPGSNAALAGGRRLAVAGQGFHAKPSKLLDQSYPMTPGFREIEQVLQRINRVWKDTGITGLSTDNIEHDDQDPDGEQPPPHSSGLQFSPVGLALELLESENSDKPQSAKRAKELINKAESAHSLSSFLKVKAELEKALQLTIQINYRQFDASVNAYNLARLNVENSCKKVIELKSRLIDCKNALGCRNKGDVAVTGTAGIVGGAAGPGGKGTEMKALQSRRDMLGEMLKLIDMIDQLKQVPEKLESLISSKNFVPATVLLVRSLKLINKPELAEIGVLNDLRAYFVNQETILFEITVEELHNHLYLKSFFCDSRWRVYQKVPVIHSIDPSSSEDAENLQLRIQPNLNTPSAPHISTFPSNLSLSSTRRKTRNNTTSSLQAFLDDLLTKPPSNPLLDEPDLFREMNTSTNSSDETMGSSSPVTHRALGYSTSSPDIKKRKLQNVNPELNSFSYIESLIESLAVLGKLSLGLDGVLQRVPLEIYNLVEGTLQEVDGRHANSAQIGGTSSTLGSRSTIGLSPGIAKTFASNNRSSASSNILLNSTTNKKASKRISVFKSNTNELQELEMISDILQDFFWTLFSKLDATLQSFRILHEVSFRISERKGFKDQEEDGIKSLSSTTNDLFSLLEVWKPIQSEVRALLHDYLIDLSDTGFGSTNSQDASRNSRSNGGGGVSAAAAAAARRNPIVSIAEVLKFNIGSSSSTTNLNASWKDPSKQLFKFKDTDLRPNQRDLKHHETNLDFALKVSVPGLVLDSNIAGHHNNNAGGILLTTGLLGDEVESNRSGGSHGNGTHRLLVKPDAFHVTFLLKPTLEFLVRAKEVLPNGVIVITNELVDNHVAGDEAVEVADDDDDDDDDRGEGMNLTQFHGFNNFLGEFILHSFLPQLEEKVVLAFEQAINTPDAFQEDVDLSGFIPNDQSGTLMRKRKAKWKLPVAKSMTTLINLIEGLCEMLQTMPFHREKYGRLIVSIVVQYYQKCHERFKELVGREITETTTTVDESNPYANLKLAADWAQRPDLSRCLQDLYHSALGDTTGLTKPFKKQWQVEEQFLENHEVELVDLIQSPKKITGLCNLYTTLDCFVTFTRTIGSSIQIVPSLEGEGSAEDPPESSSPPQILSPHLETPKSDFRMPLTRGIMRRFQMAQSSYRRLSQTILFTLHIELRLQAYHYLRKAAHEGQYFLTPSDSTEPDPIVIELNMLVSTTESSLTSALPELQRRYVLLGFGRLLNRLLVNTVLELKIGNEYGFSKMCKNVLALQQNMKALKMSSGKDIEEERRQDRSMHADFERSRKFWEMAASGPDAVMNSIRTGANYSFEQFRHLLCLLCMINPKISGVENVVPAKVIGLGEDETWSQSQALNSPGFDKRKRVFNECLIELHALVLDDDDEEEEDKGGGGEKEEG